MPIIEPDTTLYDNTKKLGHEQDIIEKNSILSAYVGIRWQGHDCQFTDWSFLPSINLWRDYLPPEIESKLPGLTVGDEITYQFKAGELLENSLSSEQHTISNIQFQPPKKGLFPILPLAGRYYPKDFFSGVNGVYEGNKFPCRITSIDDQSISVDLNHPLAGRDFDMIVRIDSIKNAGAERGGRCNDIASIACDKGPGMQDILPDQQTDFFTGNPFSRLDPGNDTMFFKQPDLAPFWDRTALQQVSDLYQSLIPKKAQVLDLMAGAHSPLQDAKIDVDSVSCAGLNAVELEHNVSCNLKFTVDVNSMSSLPFDSDQFDTVLIHAAIEYVINPELLFAEIKRVLKPSGRIIISFSNRSIAEKTIQLWSGAHEFERPAIVLSYLRSCGGFGAFNSYSKRGVFRPEDDKLADRLLLSDPVYVIWADKSKNPRS
ncbi:MAG: methyltransferase domain-containing protein, partial [Gammaproteobacteria bacterium]|nr:methyltransferase domain-containing protein [Gammaproteobacteria bacterium]